MLSILHFNLIFNYIDTAYFSICLNIFNMDIDTLILCSFSILSTIALILFSLQSKKNILKGIGQIGTGVLAGIGALDSGLNLYDRYMDSKNNTGGGAPSSNDKDKDKDKNKDKKDDNKKNAADNNNDSNKK